MNIIDHEYGGAMSNTDQETDFAASSGFLLALLGTESRRLWNRMLAAYDLTAHQFSVLTALGSLGETYQQRLSTYIGIDPRNAVPVLDGLRARKLVERAPDPTDRRRYLLRLTDAGAALVAELGQSGEGIEG